MCHIESGKHHCCCANSCDEGQFSEPVAFVRRFVSKKEKVEMLEGYKDQLEKELAGVKERIQELTKK